MRASTAFRASLVASLASAGATFVSSDITPRGSISFNTVKAGIVIGGSAGSGRAPSTAGSTRSAIGGLSDGFSFGASETRFRGTVSKIRSPCDVSGVYAVGNVGAAVGRGGGDCARETARRRAVL